MHRTDSPRLLSLLALTSFAVAAGCGGGPQPTSGPGRGPTTGPPAVAARPLNVAAVADEMIERTNGTRRAAGLPALVKSVNLMSAAQIQAEQMVKAGRMEHVLPGQPHPTLKARLTAVQYNVRAAGENIAEGQRNAAEVLATWMDSARHRTNIMSREYTEVGTGVAAARNGRLYFVTVFGRPARTSSTSSALRMLRRG